MGDFPLEQAVRCLRPDQASCLPFVATRYVTLSSAGFFTFQDSPVFVTNALAWQGGYGGIGYLGVGSAVLSSCPSFLPIGKLASYPKNLSDYYIRVSFRRPQYPKERGIRGPIIVFGKSLIRVHLSPPPA